MYLFLLENRKKEMKNSELRNKITNIINNSQTVEGKLQEICDLLRKTIPYYDWVGFYFRNGGKCELKLAQFSGKPTEHKLIPFGKGICGQVAISNKNFIVQDVLEQDNYISCGLDVKSEIVIPIFKDGVNIGQIDIDSHKKNAFAVNDEKNLEFICKQVSKII
jgi:GAF domain-containing protein